MKNLSLRAKLYFLSGSLLTIATAIGVSSFWFSDKAQSAFKEVVSNDVPSLRAVNRMLLAYRLARVELLQAVSPETSVEEDEKSIRNIDEQWTAFEKNVKQYADAGLTPEEKILFDAFNVSAEKVKQDFDAILALHHKHPVQGSADERAMLKLTFRELPAHSDAVRDATQKLIDFQARTIDANVESAIVAGNLGHRISFFVLLIGMVLGVTCTLIFTTTLVKGLRAISRDISQASTQVSTASEQIASASEELSQASTEQAASLQQTSASIEQISSMVNKNADGARDSNRISENSQETMKEGKSAISQMIAAIRDIDQSNVDISAQIERSNREISEIVKVIGEIGNKTKVINDIVFQTKLLSFNASVEAARAGEHGKGFAVVAEEVGNLAQMSGNAAKEITSMLDGSILKVEQIVNNTKTRVEQLVGAGKDKVQVGTDVARRCDEVFGEIERCVVDVGARVGEIAIASSEQAKGVQEINGAMAQMDQVTQQNAAVSQQSASAATELSAQAQALSQTVARLVQTIQGGEVEYASSTPTVAVSGVSRRERASRQAA